MPDPNRPSPIDPEGVLAGPDVESISLEPRRGVDDIDLRSDTVTRPTPAMREAMSRAEVGDDVMGEDPTVNRLEAEAAERFGKAAALFVPSGTMANLASLLAHCGRGEEIVVGDRSHIFLNEAGGSAAVGGIHPYVLPNEADGTLDPDRIERAIRGDDPHHPRTRLICLESTHNRCDGAPLALDYLDAVKGIAERHGLSVHLDGARIFNAATALGIDVREIAGRVDTLTCCLSKGLAAPVGSLVCGPTDFIARARRARKMLGGGMRQAGVLAAAGRIALTAMTARLVEDHENARRLHAGLRILVGLETVSASPRSNIVYFTLKTAALEPSALLEKLKARGVRVGHPGERRFRCVTHLGIEAVHIDRTLDAFRAAMGTEA